MPFEKATFYASIRKSTLFDGTLSKRQVEGTDAILDAWNASKLTDERWLAYMLGTTYHETGRAMYPVPEGGRGKGHPYGVANEHGQVGYGRGYVQLTWNGPPPKADNYARADDALGLGGKLVADNDLALEPAIAAQILIRGMTEGWFTHFKLSDYLNDHLADYLHARRIVNGMDKAEQIAGYALVFWQAIQVAAHKAADTSAVQTVRPAPAPSDPLSDALQNLGDAIQAIVQPPAASSPGAPATPPATQEVSSMNPLSILIQMLGGVAGKLGVASTVVQALPHVVSGTVSNIAEVPKAIADINELIADIKTGKWSDVPDDVHAILTEFGKIVSNYGIDLTALTAMVPKIAEAGPVPDAVAKVAEKTAA